MFAQQEFADAALALPISTAAAKIAPKAHQPGLAGAGLDHDIGRFDVLVNEAPTVQLLDCGSKTDRNAQEQSHLHRRSDQLCERHTPRIFEDKRSSAFVSREINCRD